MDENYKPEPGIRKCMKCGAKFVSPDPIRIWRCHDCHADAQQYSPRASCMKQVSHVIKVSGSPE